MNVQLDSKAAESGELDRLVQAAKDALTDDIVARLAATASDGADLLDRVNRSGVAKALPHLAEMANNGDLERLAQLARLVGSAQDALTDDMVSRLAEMAGGSMDMLDQITRAQLGKAIPVIAKLIQNGDLERVADLARLVGSAQDALTDDMVSRLADTAGGAISLVDQINRAQLDKAIPVIARMVHTGDLDRLADLARLVGSAQDALTDDMVSRLAEAIGGGLAMLDRLQRGSGDRLVNMLERLDSAGTIEKLAEALPSLVNRLDMVEGLLHCLEKSATEAKEGAHSPGGLMGLFALMRRKDTQETLGFLLGLARNMQAQCSR
ncbi:MAG: DUF1641 domain-containing protein [Betaproteobacteria bacterium]|nr:DUF1641 domain-containing protein [Betaproteobacteria bacterium]